MFRTQTRKSRALSIPASQTKLQRGGKTRSAKEAAAVIRKRLRFGWEEGKDRYRRVKTAIFL